MAYAQHFGMSRTSPLLKEGPTESQKKWGYSDDGNWVTGTEYTDADSEYNTVGGGKDRGAWDPKGGSDGKGGYTKATFTDKELSDAAEKTALEKKQAMLGVIKGPDGEKIAWKDNEKYNPNAGYKQGFDENGKPIHNSRGEKMFLGDKDVTEELSLIHI